MDNEVNQGGLWCRQVLAALDDWVEGALSEQVAESVREHVGSCDRCAAFGQRYARLVTALREMDVEAGRVPDELLQRLTSLQE